MRYVWLLSALGTVGLAACSSTAETPPPVAAAKPEPAPVEVDPRYAAFTFGHTLSLFRPEGAELVPIVEMGDATKRTMKAVVAVHQAGTLSIALWTFSQLEDDTLSPSGAPEPLLPLTKDGTADTDAIDALRVQMTAPRSVVTRPQGVEADTALAAVTRLAKAAAAVRDEAGQPRARTEALALFARGLDDQYLFSKHGLALALDTVSAPGELQPVPSPSKRRATVKTADGTRLTLLDKSEGWVLETIERPTPQPAK